MSLSQEIWEKDVLNGLKTCGIPMIPLMTMESWQIFLIMDHLMKMTFFFLMRGDEDHLGDFYFDQFFIIIIIIIIIIFKNLKF